MRISDWSSDVCSSDLTVLGGARGTEGLVEHHIAALGTEGDLHGIGQNVDAPQHARAGIGAKLNVFRSTIWFYSLLQNANDVRSEESRVGKEGVIRVDLVGSRNIKKKKIRYHRQTTRTKNKSY